MRDRSVTLARILAVGAALVLAVALTAGLASAAGPTAPSTSTRDLEDVPTWVFVLSLVLITSIGLILRGPARGAETNRI